MINTQRFNSCFGYAKNILKASRGNILVICGKPNSGKSLLLQKLIDLYPKEKTFNLPTWFLSKECDTVDINKTDLIDDRILLTCEEFYEDWNTLDIQFISKLTMCNLIITTLKSKIEVTEIFKTLETKLTILEL